MRVGLMISVAVTAVAAATPAAAQSEIRRYDIEAQDLASALRRFSDISGREVVAPGELVAGKRSVAIRGQLDAGSALAQLLRASRLRVEMVEGAFVLRPDAPQSDDAPLASGEAIVVTGTRIRGAAPVGSPVLVIDREAIDQSGRATVVDLLQIIPQKFGGGATEATSGNSIRSNANTNVAYGSSINLRGLGTASTLTLFDGVRPALGGAWGAFTDISLVPSTAIDRIEMLTDGASAIYGSDAVAGVVNLRFRNRFEGFETRLRSGTADGDFSEVQLSQIAGTRWGIGGVTVAVEYYDRGALPGAQRRFFSEDLRPFGGPDFRSNYAAPGNIIAGGMTFGIPPGQDGRNLTPGQLLPGVVNRRDLKKDTDILPSQRTASGYLAIDQGIGEHVSIFARGLYAHRYFRADGIQNGPSTVTVPVTNPFYVDPIGTHAPVRVQYNISRDFGPEGRVGTVDGLNGAAGLNLALGSWNIELSGGYGLELEHARNVNSVNSTRLAAALADPDPATAFNVFGMGGNNNPQTIAAIRGGYWQRVRYRVWTGALRVDGTLFDLPAGPLRMAAGAEYRDDLLSVDIHTDLSGTPRDGTIAGLPGQRQVSALYGELSIPIVNAAGAFPGRLDASVAARREHYSDVGDTTNPKLGLRWEPTPGLALRGSFGTSFRAPFFNELVGEANALYQPLYLPDPQAPGGQTLVLGLFGFKPDLGPERATTWTAGIDLSPALIPGLTASASYFEVRYRDRIAAANLDLLNFLVRRDIYGELLDETPEAAVVAGYFANPNFSNPLGVAPGQIAVIVDGRTRNLSRVTTDGIDFDLGYRFALGSGHGDLRVAGTRMLRFDQQITAQAPQVALLGTMGSPVKLRLRGSAGWSSERFSASVAANYVGAYSNRTVSPAQDVGAWTTFDLQLGTTIPTPGSDRRLRLLLSVTNLFDRDPPFVINQLFSSGIGYDPEQASAVGRMVSLQAIVAW